MYLRLMHQVSFFPPFFEGEEAQSLDLAKGTCEYAAYTHSWWASVKGGAIEYNKGYAWALVPFYLHYGYDVRLIPYILPVFFSLFIAAFFTLFRKAYPRSSLLSFALLALYAVLCLCLRRYKWHTLTYLTAVSVYLYFLPKYCTGYSALAERLIKAVAVFLFAASCYFYFGGFLYAIPFFALIVMFSTKAQRKKEFELACLAFIAQAFVGTPPGCKIRHAYKEATQKLHARSSALTLKKRAMMAAVCSQSRVSVCSCFRPAPVRR